VFFFFMGGICVERPLKLGFYAKSMRDVIAIFRAFLCWVESGVKPPHSKAAAATENIRVN
jgi:hypothetical protein